MTSAFNVLQAAAGRSAWDDSWDTSRKPAADVPDPAHLHHAADRMNRDGDMWAHLPNSTTTADLLHWVADVIAAGAPARLPIGLTQWMDDVIKAARGEEG